MSQSPYSNAIFGLSQIAAFADDKPVRLTIEGFAATNEQLWLTNMQGGFAPNFQLLNAIGAGQYIDVFNQRLTQWQITGNYVLCDCKGPLQTKSKPPFQTFYEENNIVVRAQNNKGPLKITFNGIVLSSHLIGLNIGDYQKEGIDGHTFTLLILAQLPGTVDNSQAKKQDKPYSGPLITYDINPLYGGGSAQANVGVYDGPSTPGQKSSSASSDASKQEQAGNTSPVAAGDTGTDKPPIYQPISGGWVAV